MRRFGRTWALGMALVLLTAGTPVVSALASPAGPASTGIDDLEDARQELDDASRDLDDLRSQLDRVDAEVAALDADLLAASTALDELRTELTQARDAHERSLEALDDATATLVDADTELTETLEGWRADRDRLAARARHAYVHGSTAASEVLLRGIGGAGDWHEVVVTLETVGRLIDDDAALVDSGARATRDTAQLRAVVATARRDAVDAAQSAAQDAREISRLEQEQADALAATERARADRAAVLAQLEDDTAVHAALVADLEARVADLELSAEAVLVPVDVDLDPYGPPPAWAAGLGADGRRWAAAIDATAARHGLDGRLLAALVWTESGFRPEAVSSAGALGLAQLMPGTARGLGVDPRDPLDNLDGGARYLRHQLEAFGRVDLALAAYNAGPARVQGRIPEITETQLYVRRVLERYERLGG